MPGPRVRHFARRVIRELREAHPNSRTSRTNRARKKTVAARAAKLPSGKLMGRGRGGAARRSPGPARDANRKLRRLQGGRVSE